MAILVAGGAGFIGSHLCKALLDRGAQVLCVDNLITGRMRNLHELEQRRGFEFVRHDVSEPLASLPAVELVYHLASPASPPGYQRHPIETLRVNSEGTRHLLELARVHSATMVFASTSEVYGDPLEHPQREDYRGNVSPVGPRSMYDEGKRFGEALTMAFARSCGLDGRIVRIFNTYGPHSDPCDGRLVPNFIVQALSGKPMTVYGDGSQTRSLCYVSDLVAGLLLAGTRTEARHEVINLGNPEEHTILEFAELIRNATGSRSQLAFVEQAVGDDPKQRRPDISKARGLLGWEPEVGLSDGLARTIENFRRELPASEQPVRTTPP